MSTARQPIEEPRSPSYKKIKAIIDNLDRLHSNIAKHQPTQKEVEENAIKIMEIINLHHKEISKYESYLKNAIIDLTEIPHMQPQMQKIAFEVALKDAKKNLEAFLHEIASHH